MKLQNTPYTCHVFACVNERADGRKSCGGSGNFEVFSALKRESKERGWNGRIRVSRGLCFGLCESGPNVMIYPRGIWFSHVAREDVSAIISKIAELLAEQDQTTPS